MTVWDRAQLRSRLGTLSGIKLPKQPKPKKTQAQKDREKAEREVHQRALETGLIQMGIRFKTEQLLLGEEFPSYRWDFAILNEWDVIVLGVEVNGKIWHKGGHNTGRGLLRDWDKWNTLLADRGIPTLPVAPEHIKDGRAVGWILGHLRRLEVAGPGKGAVSQ